MLRLETRAAAASSAWEQANPELAATWRSRIEQQRSAGRTESDRRRREEIDSARSELARSALEARVLAQVAAEALERLSAAQDRCRAAGLSESEIAAQAALERLPGLRPLPAPPSGRQGGGFGFLYGEAGVDADGDGDVDGGGDDFLGGLLGQ